MQLYFPSRLHPPLYRAFTLQHLATGVGAMDEKATMNMRLFTKNRNVVTVCCQGTYKY